MMEMILAGGIRENPRLTYILAQIITTGRPQLFI